MWDGRRTGGTGGAMRAARRWAPADIIFFGRTPFIRRNQGTELPVPETVDQFLVCSASVQFISTGSIFTTGNDLYAVVRIPDSIYEHDMVKFGYVLSANPLQAHKPAKGPEIVSENTECSVLFSTNMV